MKFHTEGRFWCQMNAAVGVDYDDLASEWVAVTTEYIFCLSAFPILFFRPIASMGKCPRVN